ncbi:MAG: hypothetical protein IT258_14050 [Saprospiraceae bacterium]|nr:hypothetical protein [Saprospiraceae bacterium]
MTIPLMAFAQNPVGSLKGAFEAAKQSKKPLLVIRYEQRMVDYPNTYQNETWDSRLEALLNEAQNKQALSDGFVVYRLNTDTLNAEELQFQDQFMLYYTPNFIVFSSEGELIHFYNPIPALLTNDKIDVLGELRDTLKAKATEAQVRHALQGKFDQKTISTKDLLQLITLRTNAHLKSKDAFNELAVRKAPISEELLEPILSQDFKTTDPMVRYILDNFKPKNLDWAYYKTALVESLFENAKMNKDKAEFENVLRLKGDYSSQAIEMASEAYPENPFLDEERHKEYLSEQLISEKFDFYASIADTVNVKKYGNYYAAFVLTDYEKRKKAVVDAEMAVGDYMSNSFILSGDAKKDSVVLAIRATYEKNREMKIIQMEKYFDAENARILNNIAWTYYELITQKADLEKALVWSHKSIELDENAYYQDSYAHLFFKLGDIDKAIEHETKALEQAKTRGHTKYIQDFEAALKRFKQSGKD